MYERTCKGVVLRDEDMKGMQDVSYTIPAAIWKAKETRLTGSTSPRVT